MAATWADDHWSSTRLALAKSVLVKTVVLVINPNARSHARTAAHWAAVRIFDLSFTTIVTNYANL
jgi:hypothetical protein